MRILRLMLKNYVGIYAGMGLHKIDIDFSRCVHQICIIRGDNGSGKSTILKALSPINDSSKDYLEGYEAVKDIVYGLDDGSILDIRYTSPWKGDKRGNTNLHVNLTNSKGTIDLNPNGNLGEGKEIICDKLGIDDDFLLLAQLSSDDRGLADKVPSERKRFINSKISQLDFYNALYKKLVKKSSELKTLITSINTKITDLGNVEQIKSSIKSMENSMGDMEDRKNYLIASIAREQTKENSFDRDGIPLNIAYSKAKAEFMDVNDRRIQLENTLKDFESLNGITKEKVDELVSNLRAENAEKSARITEITTKSTALSNSIKANMIKRDKFGDASNIRYVITHREELRSNLETYENMFAEVEFSAYDNMTEDDYRKALSSIEMATKQIDFIRDKFGSTEREAMLNPEMYAQIMNGFNKEMIERAKENIEESKRLLSEQEEYKKRSKGYELIPSDCSHHSDCPFINEIVAAKACIISDKQYNNILENIETLEEEIRHIEDAEGLKLRLIQCESEFRNLYSMLASDILKNFPGMDWVVDREKIIQFVNSGRVVILDTKEYLKRANLITLIRSIKAELMELDKAIERYENNKTIIDTLSEVIEKDELEYHSLREEVDKLNKDISDNEEKIRKSDELKIRLQEFEEISKEYQEVYERYVSLEKDIKTIETDLIKLSRIKERSQTMMAELKVLNTNQIPKIQDELQAAKYKMVLYNDYLEQYKKYKKEADWVDKLKYYSSPTTGIQTVYMEMFMNEILVTANKLLQSFFNGEFVLQPFIINEKEFRMPCMGNAILNDDISSMSTAQICMISMILSFALLRSTSNNYSIIKLDEIDGGLDANNRLNFVSVLSQLMNMLNYEQCIMISHNSEIAMYNADLIMLKQHIMDTKLDGANLVWSYYKEGLN